jgi:hypothetical protein
MARRKSSRGKSSSARNSKENRRAAKSGSSATAALTAEKSTAQDRFRNHTLPLIILVFTALLAYVNAWPNNLTLDDTIFAMGGRLSGVSLADIWLYFTADLWAAVGGGTGLYRPLFLLSVALDIKLFGEWAAGYHLVNIILHVLVTVLVYGFTRYLLRVWGGAFPQSGFVSMLAAGVFAVHPIHTEVVNSIFNRSDMLVTAGIVGGLWWFLQTLDKNPRKAWAGLSLIYLLVLLCKETGVVLPALAVVMLWTTTAGNWAERLRRCIPVFWLLVPLGIYLGLRANALDGPAERVVDAVAEANQMHAAVDSGMYFDTGKLLPAVTVWFDALKMMFWPQPLLAFHGSSETNQWIALSSQLILLALAITGLIQKRFGLIVGLAFFYISVLPSSRIIGAAAMFPHFAERYFYLPSVGLAIVLAVGLGWMARRFALKTAVVVTLTAVIFLTPLTWARNAQWGSTALLMESDYRSGNQSGNTLTTLVSALRGEGEDNRAGELCDRHADAFQTRWHLSVTCGQVYEKFGRYEKAEQAFTAAMNYENGKASAHFSMASMYLGLNRKKDAKAQFEEAVVAEKQDFMKAFLEAEMLVQMYPSQRMKLLEAKALLEKTILLQPQFYHAQVRLDDLEQTLNAGNRRRN